MWISKSPVSGQREGWGRERHEEAQPFTERGFVQILHLCFYPELSAWGNVFPNKLSSNQLSGSVFLEHKKLTRLRLLASLQVSVAEIQQESVTLEEM